jgi:hypothetical protein
MTDPRKLIAESRPDNEILIEEQWERETCPLVDVADHDDNTGTGCRSVGRTRWTHLDHDCCSVCDELQEQTMARADIKAWRALKAARPPITTDRAGRKG